MEQLIARPRTAEASPPQGAPGALPILRRAVAERWQAREDFWLGVAFSLLAHMLLLCGLALWKYIEEPAAEGLTFTSAIGEDAGLSGPLDSLPVIDSAPAGDDAPLADAPPALVDPTVYLGAGPGSGETPVHAIAAALAGAGDPGRGGGGGTGHGGGVAFFGTRGEGRSFVFIVDFSGSMRGQRVERARDELIRSIDELKVYQKFFIFLYNTDTYPLFELTSRADLVVASPEKRKRAIRWVREHDTGRGTQPQEAFRRALAMQPDVIFFLTDGEIPEETRGLVLEGNQHKTIVHTIGFQSRDGEEILKGIAHDNHGRYRFVE